MRATRRADPHARVGDDSTTERLLGLEYRESEAEPDAAGLSNSSVTLASGLSSTLKCERVMTQPRIRIYAPAELVARLNLEIRQGGYYSFPKLPGGSNAQRGSADVPPSSNPPSGPAA